MKAELKHKYYNLFVLLQSFENLWTYKFLSEGELYEIQCKKEADNLVTYLSGVYKLDKGIYNSKTITLDSNDSEEYVREILKGLKKWSKGKSTFPIFFNGLGGDLQVNYMIQKFILCIKAYLSSQIKFESQPQIIWSSAQEDYRKNEIRWKGHLPWQAIEFVSDVFVEELSNSDTIVVVADIRKSQDLMTYGPSADFFRDKILEFTSEMRKIIKNNFGIFDKFTGDGFLCYFNSKLCAKFGKNYYEQMMKAAKEVMLFSDTFFEEWVKNIRKLPPNSSGLTLGIDSGVVKFRDLDSHLFAIGDAIVWANRMSSAGNKNEVIMNNLPFHKLKELNPKLEFNIIENVTKGGDAFTAYKINLK